MGQSYFAGKTVAVAGYFTTLDQENVKHLLSQLGANVKRYVNENTDLLIFGRRPGSKLDAAIELGVEQWDESRLKVELEDSNQQLLVAANAYYLSSHSCAVGWQNGDWQGIKSLVGMPIAHGIYQTLFGHQYAYSIRQIDEPPLWHQENAGSVQALAIEYLGKAQFDETCQHLHCFPNLKTLAINTCHEVIVEADKIISILPNLECLFVKDTAIEFSVARLSSIQQLYLETDGVGGLSLLSLPSLKSTFINKGTMDAFVNSLNTNSLPNLRHIEVSETSVLFGLLPAIPKGLPIESIKVTHWDWVSEIALEEIDRCVKQLASWQGAKRLTHIAFNWCEVKLPRGLNHENFPALNHIGLCGWIGEEAVLSLEQLEPWEGLSLDLSECQLDTSVSHAFFQLLERWSGLKSLNVQRVELDPAFNIRLGSLPYPVLR